MLMVIRVQAAVKNVVRKMNNALTTIITNIAASPPGDLESLPLIVSYTLYVTISMLLSVSL